MLGGTNNEAVGIASPWAISLTNPRRLTKPVGGPVCAWRDVSLCVTKLLEHDANRRSGGGGGGEPMIVRISRPRTRCAPKSKTIAVAETNGSQRAQRACARRAR